MWVEDGHRPAQWKVPLGTAGLFGVAGEELLIATPRVLTPLVTWSI